MKKAVRLSSRGRLTLPKEIQAHLGWTPGVVLVVEDHRDSVVLRRVEYLPETNLKDLVGCAGYGGSTRSLEDMEAGIAEGARKER